MANKIPSDSAPTNTVAPVKNKSVTAPKLSPDIEKLLNGRLHDPFAVLGKHPQNNADLVRVFLPHAEEVYMADLDEAMTRVTGTDLFEWTGPRNSLPKHHRIEWYDAQKNQHAYYDPYSFEPQLSDFDLHLFGEGKHWHAYNMLGAHVRQVDDIDGVLFSVWAPNAQRISVIADFNQWDGRCHPMRSRGGSGIWELFIPELSSGVFYKFEIVGKHGELLIKADPYGQAFEMRPSNASIVCDNTPFLWQDQDWIKTRQSDNWLHEPQSVYEVHLGSWQRGSDGKFLNYIELAERLVKYVSELGFTHIQLLPLTEHPLDASWGYQTTGYFAPTSRFGTPDEFRYFINHCHSHGIGVIMDWVPAHFPKDAHALARFDGTAVYEHEDPRRGEHRDWGTYIYNYGRNEVRNLLLSSAVYWLKEFHIDGLRVDAVASMLYLDYSREAGDWVPNMYGGNENLEAIDFMRQLNEVIHGEFPGCMVIAEESTAWPQVTRPTWLGGLGFSMKWNMGWMHDSLEYFKHDPVHRTFHHDQLTFGLLYAFTENFVLPLSHDEVVHGKGSILNRMPGDDWQRYANLRLLYTYMFVYPGKKLLFMGCEFAQPWEWNFDAELPWHLLQYAPHQGIRNLVSDANQLYRKNSPLHKYDFDHRGFEWIDCHDAGQSIISFIRRDDDDFIIAAFNFTPVPRHAYRLGVPEPGTYEEILNSDSEHYNGSNIGNLGAIQAEETPWMGRPYSISLTLPPLAGVVLRRRSDK